MPEGENLFWIESLQDSKGWIINKNDALN